MLDDDRSPSYREERDDRPGRGYAGGGCRMAIGSAWAMEKHAVGVMEKSL